MQFFITLNVIYIFLVGPQLEMGNNSLSKFFLKICRQKAKILIIYSYKVNFFNLLIKLIFSNLQKLCIFIFICFRRWRMWNRRICMRSYVRMPQYIRILQMRHLVWCWYEKIWRWQYLSRFFWIFFLTSNGFFFSL